MIQAFNRITITLILAISLILISGCGGNDVATKTCNTMEQMVEGEFSVPDSLGELVRLGTLAEEKGYSDEEMEEAIGEQCGEIRDEMQERLNH